MAAVRAISDWLVSMCDSDVSRRALSAAFRAPAHRAIIIGNREEPSGESRIKGRCSRERARCPVLRPTYKAAAPLVPTCYLW